jgi:thioredoxin 1
MMLFALFKRRNRDHDLKQMSHSINKWPDHVVTLERKTFRNFIEKYPLSMVDFWASWCSPCRAMAPRLRRLSKIYKGKVAFGKLDIQENKDIAKRYKVIGIPHFVFFSYGKKIGSMTGAKSLGDIKDAVKTYLGKI